MIKLAHYNVDYTGGFCGRSKDLYAETKLLMEAIELISNFITSNLFSDMMPQTLHSISNFFSHGVAHFQQEGPHLFLSNLLSKSEILKLMNNKKGHKII